MFRKLVLRLCKRVTDWLQPTAEVIPDRRNFTTDPDSRLTALSKEIRQQERMRRVFQRTGADIKIVHYGQVAGSAMDSAPIATPVQTPKAVAAMDSIGGVNTVGAFTDCIPDLQLDWYAGQNFIGYQTMAMLAQNWLIDKCCTIPACDAIRQGYEITVNDGTEVKPEIIKQIRRTDRRYQVNRQLIDFVRKGRIFGIRVAMFVVDVPDPVDFYLKPFNIDGVKKGSYKGIKQLDPYWLAPELDFASAADPGSLHFYEPTWWRLPNGMRVHRTHLIIMTTGEVPDILKPTYFYGGISLPQKIANRVYAAERTADEAPQLALAKRTDIIFTDLTQAVADPVKFEEKMQFRSAVQNNFGAQFLSKDDDEFQRHDTSLADLDEVIMSQFQLVAATANIPATKLLGTSPKGFNATGEFEEATYHEELETIQELYDTPLLERHYALVIKSDLNMKPFDFDITWGTLDTMTAKEHAEVNETKARTGKLLVEGGAIDGGIELKRIIADPDSGYNGIPDIESFVQPEEETDPFDEDGGNDPREPSKLTKENNSGASSRN